MDKKKFQRLKEEVEGTNHYKTNRSTYVILNLFSYILHVLSGLLASYFILNKLSEALDGKEHFNYIFYPIAFIVVLAITLYEISKNKVFSSISLKAFKREFNLSIVGSAIMAIVIVSTSTFISMKGAEDFMSKEEVVIEKVEGKYKAETDTLRKEYEGKISAYRKQIDYVINLAKEDSRPLSYYERADINKWESYIQQLEKDKKEALSKTETAKVKESDKKLEKNEERGYTFLMIALFIELMLLYCVSNEAGYKYKSHKQFNREFTDKLKKQEHTMKILKILYGGGNGRVGDPVPGIQRMKLLMEKENIIADDEKVTGEMQIMLQLGVLQRNGTRTKLAVSYEEAKEKIEQYFDM